MAKKVIINGGGWAGCAAALAARQAGAEVELFERTDMLLGTGLVGGIIRNNGRFSATEELIAMGGGKLFQIADQVARHKNVEFPGHKHVSLYDVAKIEPAVKKALLEAGVKIHLCARVKDIEKDGDTITTLIAEHYTEKKEIKGVGDSFVDASGTAGPQGNCTKYGNGCVMCIFRCPTFGPRMSIAGKAGITELIGKKPDGSIGAMSGSCKLLKDSLSKEIVEQLDTTGVAIIPIPKHLQKGEASLTQKACQQYALAEFNDNIILLDTGHAKLMTAYYPLAILRQIPGFEEARYEDPYAGGIGNSMRYVGMSPRNNALHVDGLANVFCGGEKAGLLVGHTEAIITGTLAGHNAARAAFGQDPIILPTSLACGDAIAFVKESMQTEEGMTKKYTFSGSVYFERMKRLNLYTTDIKEIKDRVEEAGMTNVFKS
ncbi:FAD-dependent oxidoreductase [Anaerosporomusa subterranea]|uniref:FAD-dependent oxidoreductase n=1 Tax=Anaerosporomusa subterranea TaxID=1794912 RepID=A0A154BRN6_ANASB|nr:FAD-dependent oxidoreductase [Anaerosporomusa subterranea]KYZ76569.1 FAD-dependent oxidoreductase [Anaerosporomusa subterranea]